MDAPHVEPSEQWIIGDGSYDNLRVSRVADDVTSFSIIPAKTPWVMIVLVNLLFIAAGVAFYLVLRRFRPEIGRAVPLLVCGGMGVFTCTLFTLIVTWRFGSELKRGPWLTYDKRRRILTLPRLGQQFALTEIVHVQYITTRRQRDGGFFGDLLSELNVVTLREGRRARWHLVRSILSHGAFEHVLRPMLRSTPIPIVRVRQRVMGRELHIERYNG